MQQALDELLLRAQAGLEPGRFVLLDAGAPCRGGDRLLQPADTVDQTLVERILSDPHASLRHLVDRLRLHPAALGDHFEEALVAVIHAQLHRLRDFGRHWPARIEGAGQGDVATPSTASPNLPNGSDRSGNMPKMPIEPVMVVALASTSSAAIDTQ